MTLQAIVFDVDGTLADTERDGHRLAFNAAFADAGIDWSWDVALYGELLAVTGGKERIRFFVERYCPIVAKRAGFDEMVKALHAAKTKHYVRLVEKGGLPLRPGVASLIGEARAAGVRLGIATTTTLENVSALLSATLGPEAESWFEVIGAGDVVPDKKPAPDIYRWVLQELKLSASDCIAIEDSANGLRSSLGAGIMTIITESGYTHRDDFRGALAVLPDLTDVGLAEVRRYYDSGLCYR